MILVARLFTVLFGAGTVYLAILVPAAGGIVEVVLSTAAIAGGSLFGPVIYSLFSKRQTATSLITISAVSLLVSLFFKIFGSSVGVQLSRTMETVVVSASDVPAFVYELYAYTKKVNVPYMVGSTGPEQVVYNPEAARQNRFGIQVIAWSTLAVGIGIAVLGFIAVNGRVALTVGLVIILIAAAILRKQYAGAMNKTEALPGN